MIRINLQGIVVTGFRIVANATPISTHEGETTPVPLAYD